MRLIQINLDDPKIDGAIAREIENIVNRQKAEYHEAELKKLRATRRHEPDARATSAGDGDVRRYKRIDGEPRRQDPDTGDVFPVFVRGK